MGAIRKTQNKDYLSSLSKQTSIHAGRDELQKRISSPRASAACPATAGCDCSEIAKSHDRSGAEGQTHRCRSPTTLTHRNQLSAVGSDFALISATHPPCKHRGFCITYSFRNSRPFETLWLDSMGRDWRYGDSLVPEEVGVAVIVNWRPPSFTG